MVNKDDLVLAQGYLQLAAKLPFPNLFDSDCSEKLKIWDKKVLEYLDKAKYCLKHSIGKEK